MSENGVSNTKSTLARLLRGGEKPMSPTLTEEDELDEVIARSISGTHHMRVEIREWKQRSHQLDSELHTIRHEYEAKLSAARSENEMLKRQLSDTGAKMEIYQRRSLELETKCNDLELFYRGELEKIQDATNMSHQVMATAVTGSARSMNAFLDDLDKKRKAAEYRRPGSNEQRLPASQLTPEENKRLEALAAQFSPAQNPPQEPVE